MKNSLLLQNTIFKLFDLKESWELNLVQQKRESSLRYEPIRNVSGSRADHGGKEKVYGEFHLCRDHFTRGYSGGLYTVLDFLGELGGLMDVLAVIGALMTGFIVDKLWVGAMIKDVYYV